MLSRPLALVRRYAALALVLGLAACKSATDACDPNDPFCGSNGPVPTTVTLDPSAVTLTSVGATRQIAATVLDQNGQTINGAAVTWRSDNQSVVTVSASGLLRAEGAGNTQIQATSGSATAAADVSVCVPLVTMAFDDLRFDNLATTDCHLENDAFADFWTLEITTATAGQVQVDLLSATFDTYVGLLGPTGAVLAENDDHATSVGAPFYDLSSRVVQTLAAGRYTIVATSFNPQTTGAYQLSAGPGLLCPEEGVVALGTSTTGQALAVDDCSYDEYFADAYVVRVSTANPVTFTLTSPDFDAYLTLLDPSGNVMHNDDDGAGGTDAQISVPLTPAWYVIEVSSAFTGETGNYTLTVN